MSLKVNEGILSSANDNSLSLNESDALNIGEHVSNRRLSLPNRMNEHGASEEALINRIPAEILIYIFKLFVHAHDSPAVGILLFVCWYWHELVENTPSLWSRIALCPKQWERNSPIADSWRRGQSNEALEDLLAPLYSDDTLEVEEEFWEALCHPAPLLQELYLHIDELFLWDAPVPALRTLVLDAIGRLEDIDFSPDTLETLCFRLWSMVGFLRPFVNLRNLAIVNHMLGGEGADYGDEPVQLSHLDCLTIQWVHGWRFPVKMVRQIQAPALKTLRLLGSMAIQRVLKAACFHHVRDLHLAVEKAEANRQKFMKSAYLEAKIAAYVGLEEFTVARWHLKAAIEAVKGLRAKDQGPGLLQHIRTMDKDMKGELIADDASFCSVGCAMEVYS